MLTDNSSGDVEDVKRVLLSIKQRICDNLALTSVYRIRVVFDIVCKDVDSGQRKDIFELTATYMTGGHTSRISPKSLGPAQTDSLLVSLNWMTSLHANTEAP